MIGKPQLQTSITHASSTWPLLLNHVPHSAYLNNQNLISASNESFLLLAHRLLILSVSLSLLLLLIAVSCCKRLQLWKVYKLQLFLTIGTSFCVSLPTHLCIGFSLFLVSDLTLHQNPLHILEKRSDFSARGVDLEAWSRPLWWIGVWVVRGLGWAWVCSLYCLWCFRTPGVWILKVFISLCYSFNWGEGKLGFHLIWFWWIGFGLMGWFDCRAGAAAVPRASGERSLWRLVGLGRWWWWPMFLVWSWVPCWQSRDFVSYCLIWITVGHWWVLCVLIFFVVLVAVCCRCLDFVWV